MAIRASGIQCSQQMSPPMGRSSCYRTRNTTVAMTRYQRLGVSRHELAVMIRQLCLGCNRQQTVVEGSVSGPASTRSFTPITTLIFRSPAASHKAVIRDRES